MGFFSGLFGKDQKAEIDPTKSEEWRNKGDDLYGFGKYEEAIEAYEKATSLIRIILMRGIIRDLH